MRAMNQVTENTRQAGIQLKSRLWFYLILLCILALTIAFLPSNPGFNNDAPAYSENMARPFLSGSYTVQMPGYLSYIYVGKLLCLLGFNPVVAQHVINLLLLSWILFEAYGLALEYSLSVNSALFFTAALGVSNAVVLSSLTGGNRLVLALASIVLLKEARRILEDKIEYRLVSFGFWFGFFLGFRQDLAASFVPLFLYLFWRVKFGRWRCLSLLTFVVICICWFAPLVAEVGGLAAYFSRTGSSEAVWHTSLLLHGPRLSPLLNVIRVHIYLLNALFWIIPWWWIQRGEKSISLGREKERLLLFAFLPAYLFQVLVHNGNFAHLLAFLIPVLLWLFSKIDVGTYRRLALAAATLLMMVGQFYLVPMFPASNDLRQELANVLWLQYSYAGVQSTHTLRLQDIKTDKFYFKDGVQVSTSSEH